MTYRRKGEKILDRLIFRKRRGFGPGALIATGIAAGLCGAAAMYLMDPVSGRRRRHVLRDRSVSFFRHGGERAVHVASDIGNRGRGLWYSVTHRWRGEADDRKLGERVKAAIGHAAIHVSGVRVHIKDGVATLVGTALEKEAQAIVRAARMVRGIKDVVNQLELRDEQQWARASGGRLSEMES